MQIRHILRILASAALAVQPSGSALPAPAPYADNHLSPRYTSDTTNDTFPNFTHGQLLSLQKQFWDAFIYPHNQVQAKAINASILAPNVQGRVDITRTFSGAELNTEYLFGLFANLAETRNAFTLLGYPTAYEITHFAASQNIASASTRLNFTFPLLPHLTVPVQLDTWSAFNSAGQLAQYDATFKWWQWAVDYLLGTAAAAHNMTLPQITRYATLQLAGSICDTATTHCNSSVEGLAKEDTYANRGECMRILTKEVRFGEVWEMGRNTLLCRMVHQNMVPLRPAVHCPHIGPTGSGYCVDDKSYAQTVGEDYFTNFPWVSGTKLTGTGGGDGLGGVEVGTA